MYTGRTLFAQVMDFVPWTSFHRIVAKYRGDIGVRTLRCTEHFRIMAFAQITYRESLRDIEACLGAQPAKLCSMGLRDPVARSTLADANELRDWRLWSDLAAVLIKRARKLYLKDDFGLDLANTVYALDSTTIDLCLSLFPWADFRSTKGAVKMHTLLDLRGPIPSFIHIFDGKMGDALALDLITPEAGAIYVMDRGYVDFRRLYAIHQAGAFFLKSPSFYSRCQAEKPHILRVLASGDEFRERIGFCGTHEKFGKCLAQRFCNDELRWRNAGTNGSQPGSERVPNELGSNDGEILEESLGDDAGLDEGMISAHFAFDTGAVVGRFAM